MNLYGSLEGGVFEERNKPTPTPSYVMTSPPPRDAVLYDAAIFQHVAAFLARQDVGNFAQTCKKASVGGEGMGPRELRRPRVWCRARVTVVLIVVAGLDVDLRSFPALRCRVFGGIVPRFDAGGLFVRFPRCDAGGSK